MLWLLWLAAKIFFGVPILFLILFMIALKGYNILVARPMINRLRKQGVFIFPGSEDLITLARQIRDFRLYVAEEEEAVSQMQYTVLELARISGKKELNAKDYPVSCFGVFNQQYVFIQDPEVVQDAFTFKNQELDKTEQNGLYFKPILGESFLFSQTDEHWKAKRKACAHAFYKDRLTLMLDTLKEQILKNFERWQEEIGKSDGSTVINIQYEFERIFSRNIITIAFGEDISDEKFEIMVETPKGSKNFTPKMVSIREALHETFENYVVGLNDVLSHPYNQMWKWTGKFIHHTAFIKQTVDNSKRIRAYINDYV